MTDLRQAAQQALEALEIIDRAMPFPVGKQIITALRKALAQPEQEPTWVGCGECDCIFPCTNGQTRCVRLKKQKPVGEIGWAANVPNTISEVRWVDGCPEIGTKIFTYPPHSDKEEIPKGVKLAISNFGVTLVKTQHGYELRKLGKITPAAQPAQPEQEPSQWRDMVVVSLVREGINKHRARELVDHFAAQRPWVGLTDEDWKKVANRKNTVLDTFEQGATWAAYKLERRNT